TLATAGSAIAEHRSVWAALELEALGVVAVGHAEIDRAVARRKILVRRRAAKHHLIGADRRGIGASHYSSRVESDGPRPGVVDVGDVEVVHELLRHDRNRAGRELERRVDAAAGERVAGGVTAILGRVHLERGEG